METSKINVGGQAIIEGVMIRGRTKYVIAVRKKSRIVSKEGRIRKKSAVYRLPIIRGFVNLAEMLAIGIKALIWSAEQAAPKGEKIGKNEFAISFMISIGAVILIFIALPYFLTNLAGFYEEKNPILFNVIDGIIRISFFLIYIFAISFMKDVKVLFQYHGAEHKAIHCYEHGKKLDVNNVRRFTTLHPRCGTSFLLIVFIVSIFVFSLLPTLISAYYPGFLDVNAWLRRGILIPIRILLIPIIAGISYEILKISDSHQKNPLFRLVTLPGLALQKITTKEPSNRQIEVALLSLKKLLKIETRK